MRCSFLTRVSTLSPTFLLLAFCTASCSGGSPEADATGGGPAPFAITVSQTYLTVENHTGDAVVSGAIEIIPVGILPPFRTQLPRLEAGGKRDVLLNTFKGGDGTPFNRNIARARQVKVTAKDRAGKTYEYAVPFN